MNETKHERWLWAADVPRCITTEAQPNDNLLVWNETEGLAQFPDPETARRVVALWNACRDLPLAALEAGALRDALEVLASLYRTNVGAEAVFSEWKKGHDALVALGKIQRIV